MPNETGQRGGETALARAYGAYLAGPYSSSRSRPHFNPPRAETLAQRFGWTVDPAERGSVTTPACIEVYPHPAMVGLFKLGQRVLYKKGPSRASGFKELVSHYESLAVLRLAENLRWAELSEVVANPQPGALTRIEDEVDAILCAHLAWLWHDEPEALQVYGDLASGYIVAPPPPTLRRSGRQRLRLLRPCDSWSTPPLPPSPPQVSDRGALRSTPQLRSPWVTAHLWRGGSQSRWSSSCRDPP